MCPSLRLPRLTPSIGLAQTAHPQRFGFSWAHGTGECGGSLVSGDSGGRWSRDGWHAQDCEVAVTRKANGTSGSIRRTAESRPYERQSRRTSLRLTATVLRALEAQSRFPGLNSPVAGCWLRPFDTTGLQLSVTPASCRPQEFT